MRRTKLTFPRFPHKTGTFRFEHTVEHKFASTISLFDIFDRSGTEVVEHVSLKRISTVRDTYLHLYVHSSRKCSLVYLSLEGWLDNRSANYAEVAIA